MHDWFSMKGRTALITGGSMSIGRSIALCFADHGASVAIHHSAAADTRVGLPDAARTTAEEIRSRGVKACVVESDLAREGGGRRAHELAQAELGPIDVLVVCASIQFRTPFLELTSDEIARQVAVNFNATIELLQAALPSMQARKWGRVLTVGSINQDRPAPDLAVYAALKSAQLNLCINLARQYAPYNVMINNLAPGLVETVRNLSQREDIDNWKKLEATAAALMGRAAQADEMVGAALLLCSEAASYIAGVDLMVTGAAHLPRT